ncbi:sphingomyelin phosphodiesterase-like isoform X4 [Dermacentor albipictus]|uniref:sphingomyelin phosphodiesterase-like isoform X4 n=1 Tax=Dermacentor albipictus TaxID=60249 RepID=UPI0031FBD1A2
MFFLPIASQLTGTAMHAAPRTVTLAAIMLLCVSVAVNPVAEAARAKKEVNIIDLLFKFGNFKELHTVMGNAAVGVVSPKACSVCSAATGLFFDYIESGRSKDGLVKIARGACAFLKIASLGACSNVIDMYKDELFYIAQNRKAPRTETCSVIFGSLCGPLTSDVHNWTIEISGPSKPRAYMLGKYEKVEDDEDENVEKQVKVLHISDTHYDPEYSPGSNAVCDDPVCCRRNNGHPKSAGDRAGKWGHIGKCDIPLRTLESALKHASENHKVDVVLWTGDLPPHDPWKATREDMLDNLRVTSALMRKYFPNATVLPAIGNHEAVPINSFPVNNGANFSTQWLYDTFSEHWMDFLPQTAKNSIRQGAFYSVEVSKGFRVISLNTNLCYLFNWWLVYNSTDPSGQLQWLSRELQRAEASGEKVYIIGHVAPVKVECIPVWADNFRRIVNRYKSTIVAQFYGHTHNDQLYLFYDDKGAKGSMWPTNVAYVAPSVTTFVFSNPAYRVYAVDGGRHRRNAPWTIVDHETFIMDLDESNKLDQPKWQLAYSAKQHYGLRSLSAESWHSLVEQFRTNETLFQDYHRFMHKLMEPHQCDKECKAREICYIQAATTTGIRECMISMGFSPA